MKKVSKIGLLAVVLAMVFSAIMPSAMAAQTETKQVYKEMRKDFMVNQTIKDDTTIPSSADLKIGTDATVTIAKGTTLTLHGSLAVEGRLVVKGILKISSTTQKGVSSAAHLSNLKKVVNEGEIHIENSNFNNCPNGVLENQGSIYIKGDREKLISFRNMSPRLNAKEKGGSVVNDGTFFLEATKGTALYIMKDSTFENNNLIKASEGANHVGTFTGNEIGVSKAEVPAVSTSPGVTPPAAGGSAAPTPPAGSSGEGDLGYSEGEDEETTPSDSGDGGKAALGRFHGGLKR